MTDPDTDTSSNTDDDDDTSSDGGMTDDSSSKPAAPPPDPYPVRYPSVPTEGSDVPVMRQIPGRGSCREW